jgi:hypothetical protein
MAPPPLFPCDMLNLAPFLRFVNALPVDGVKPLPSFSKADIMPA